MMVIKWVTQRRRFYVEPRKIMRNVPGGVDRAEPFGHERGSRCTNTHVQAILGNLACLEMRRWRQAWLEVGEQSDMKLSGKAGS